MVAQVFPPPVTPHPARPTATAGPTTMPLPGYVPHRIGVRLVDGVGEFYDRVTGDKFIPRGYNYVRLSPIFGTSGQMWEETLAPSMYDPTLAEEALREMHADGYNVVRITVDCCRPLKNIGNPKGGISSPYVTNIIDFLEKAKANDIQVILVLHLAAGDGGYSNYWEADIPEIDKLNLFYLSAGGHTTKRLYDQDLIRALIKRKAPLDTVLAYDLMNDVSYDYGWPPLSKTSGKITTANHKTYDMSKPEDKQRMMNENLVYWIDHQRTAILKVDPTALVTVSFHGSLNQSGAAYAQAAIWESSADFFDLHLYFGTGYTLKAYVNKFGISGLTDKPIIIGQFAAARQGYPSASRAAEALVDLQADSCQYGFDGWILWLRGSEEHTALWNGPTDGVINGAPPVNRLTHVKVSDYNQRSDKDGRSLLRCYLRVGVLSLRSDGLGVDREIGWKSQTTHPEWEAATINGVILIVFGLLWFVLIFSLVSD
jgi:hypothetical protein